MKTKIKNKIVVANWKMEPKTQDEALKIFNDTKKASKNLKNTKVVICPPNFYVNELKEGLGKSKKISFGVQDVFSEEEGAHTGEISIDMVKNLGVEYVIVGHSERRSLGEDDDTVSKKVNLVLNSKLNPILCVGEKERDEEGNFLLFILEQIKNSLQKVEKKHLKNLIIAYEPIWAIGKTAQDAMDSRGVHQMSLFIKKVLKDLFDEKIAEKTMILYGGSVELSNAEDLIKNGNIDGFLVGHESLDADKFCEILKIVDK
ncbi:triose-phosphate isomerase [Patescibacteria group bacterium]|nr:triose-phosphate isomerase [Patescibacteria group bacterium]MBU4057395.1 triose-phosphate isomerase [Patescibacteria group bacterium]MBU4115622.1 triose-phosphate isomerase [Patescibacteria group bacterium]